VKKTGKTAGDKQMEKAMTSRIRNTTLTQWVHGSLIFLAASVVTFAAEGGGGVQITQQPMGQLVERGATVSFSVVTEPTNVFYQWYFEDVRILGATNISFTFLRPAGVADAGRYHVEVVPSTNPTNTPVKSDIAKLAVIVGGTNDSPVYQPFDPEGGPPVITCQPEWQNAYFGSAAAFTVVAEDPKPPFVLHPLYYQWQRLGPGGINFTNVGGQTNSTLIITDVNTTNGPGFFRVVVSSTRGLTISEPAQLLVWSTNSPFTVYGSPYLSSGGSGTSCPGPYVARADYYANPTYQTGWWPDHSGGAQDHKATAGANTKIRVYGDINDGWCTAGNAGQNTHFGNPAPEDDWWVFTVYFTNSPGGSYPLTLHGLRATGPGL
jgi:hypothetical protein